MAGKLGGVLVLELFDDIGGGLRANLTSVDTALDGHRETLRSYINDYGGVAAGSTIRHIDLNEYVDESTWIGAAIDFERCFKDQVFLVYRLTEVMSNRKAQGTCHVTKTAMKGADGKVLEVNATLEGEPTLFS